MSLVTKNLGLVKPDPSDFYDVSVQNANMDKIDSAVKLVGSDGIPYVGVTINSGNTYTVTSEKISAISEGIAFSFKLNENATDSMNLIVNTSSAYPLLKQNGLGMKNGKNGSIYTVRFSGTAFILQGEGGDYGTATATEVLSGYTVGTETGIVNGAIPNYGNVGDISLKSQNEEYTIPRGYHSGFGKIKASITNLISSVIKAGTTVGGILGTFTSDANAVDSAILSGYSGYVNGSKVTGTMVNKTGAYSTTADSSTNGRIYMTPSKGYYDGSTAKIYAEDANFTADNIPIGKTIFGKTGTYGGLYPGEVAILTYSQTLTMSTSKYISPNVHTRRSGTVRVKISVINSGSTNYGLTFYKNGVVYYNLTTENYKSLDIPMTTSDYFQFEAWNYNSGYTVTPYVSFCTRDDCGTLY